MFPIRDHNPSGRTPFVTMALMGINVFVFLAMVPLYGDPYAFQNVVLQFGLIPAAPEATAFLTSMFMHGGLLHLAGNMLFLWIFGDNMEDEMGHAGFLVFYLACGVAASAAHVLSAPWSPVPMVGASGAIAGVMGGYLLMFPRARVDILIILIVFFRILPVPAWLMLMLWFGFQLLAGVGADPMEGGVAYWAHAGGFVLGMGFALPVWLRRGGPAFWRRTAGAPPHPEGQWRRTPIPRAGRRR